MKKKTVACSDVFQVFVIFKSSRFYLTCFENKAPTMQQNAFFN